jgi:hypothetical protein
MNIEDLIDKILEQFSSDENQNGELITTVEEKHQVLFDYLQAEYGEDLSEEEFEILLFPVIIILSCINEIDPKLEFDPEKYSEEEEHGFKLLEEHNSKDVFEFKYDFKYLEFVYFLEDYLEGLHEEGINKVIQNIVYVVSVSLLKSL